MKNAIITGAGGFIGRSLVRELSENGIRTIAISHQKFEEENCTLVNLPIEKIEDLPEQIDGSIDVFYHLAWKGMAGAELCSPDVQLENCSLLVKCMHAAKKIGCKKFVGAGTISQFENETNGLQVIMDKERYYRSCKGLCQRYGVELARELELSFIWPIITSAYGPAGRNSERLIYSVIRTMLCQKDIDMSEGKQMFDFVYIKDVVEAYRLIGEKGSAGRRYVIGSGKARPLREWLEPVPAILGSNGKLNFGKRQYNGQSMDQKYFDIGELTKDTGYRPKVEFEDGIQTMAKALAFE